MRILFLRKRGEHSYGPPLNMFRFQKSVERLVGKCKWAGKGWPLHKDGESVDETVRRLYGRNPPDWVIDCERNDPLNKSRNYRVGGYASDIHARSSAKAKTSEALCKHLNKMQYDALFFKAKYIYGVRCKPDFFLKNLESKVYFLPYSVDPQAFRPRKKRYDVFLTGSFSVRYPTRTALQRGLPDYCNKRGLSLRVQLTAPQYWAGRDSENDPNYLVRGRYETVMGQSRFLPFGSSIYRYPVMKYFEGPASGCVVFADANASADELGFVDGVNYVKINSKNWPEKMDYYLEHTDEADKIAINARKLVLERHTHDIRAKEFVEMLLKAG